MAQKITIENFGPIKYFEGEVKDLMIFIGPQASGKSTIAKLVYFFRSLKDEYISVVIEIVFSTPKRALDKGFIKQQLEPKLKRKINNALYQYFPFSKRVNNYKLSFNYANFSIKITKTDKLTIELGTISIKFFLPLLEEGSLLSPSGRRNLAVWFTSKEPNNLFQDYYEPIFIPAGRSVISALADQLISLDLKNNLDFLILDFVRRISRLKPLFRESFDTIVEDAQKDNQLTIDPEIIVLLKKKIYKILKGNYQYNTVGEKIYFNNENFVLLQNASSGQQESLWILLMIFNNIINQEKSFIVFEEPEAHLYPVAQKNMVDLMGLMLNNVESQLIITTHSPYILSAFNNLLLAKKVLKQGVALPKELEDLQHTAIDVNNIAAYFVENGECRSIIDEEFEQINAEEIDAASTEINDTFYKLFDLDEE